MTHCHLHVVDDNVSDCFVFNTARMQSLHMHKRVFKHNFSRPVWAWCVVRKKQMPGGILDPAEHELAIGDGTTFHRDFFLPGVFYTRLCKTELQNHAYMQRLLRSVQSSAAAAHA
jgi:hypothetical protein